MKRFNFSFLVILVAMIVFSGCSGLNKMKKNASGISFNTSPEVVEMHGGNVDIAIDARFPEKYFNTKAVVVATPVLKTPTGNVEFEPVTLQGEKVTANNKVINYKAGGKLSYKGNLPYNTDMRLSELELNIVASKGSKSVAFDPIKLADGVVSTPLLIMPKEAETIVAKDDFQRIVPESYTADIHYTINRDEVRTSETKSDDITALKNAVKAANEKDNVKFRGVEISAYASPDGELSFNDKLAGGRSKTASNFFKKELKSMKVTQADQESFYSLMKTAEDWEGFKELVGNSTIQDKDVILRVLSMYNDPVVREKEIKNIASAFTEIADEILPQLRRSKLTVNADVIGKSDDEIMKLAVSNTKELNIEELLYAASLTENIETQYSIYEAATEQNPQCFRAWNDLGMTQIMLGDYDKGKSSIEKASALYGKSPVVLNNLGVLALADGDYEKAEGLFRSAAGAGNEVDHNLGIINVNKGNYKQAVSNFGSSCLFNAALAQTLNKDYPGALKTLDCVEEGNSMVDYLRAVVYARQGNSANMFKALEAAVAANPGAKKMAQTDIEFGKYFEDAQFKSIVK